jgi:hypothetical protein
MRNGMVTLLWKRNAEQSILRVDAFVIVKLAM